MVGSAVRLVPNQLKRISAHRLFPAASTQGAARTASARRVDPYEVALTPVLRRTEA